MQIQFFLSHLHSTRFYYCLFSLNNSEIHNSVTPIFSKEKATSTFQQEKLKTNTRDGSL